MEPNFELGLIQFAVTGFAVAAPKTTSKATTSNRRPSPKTTSNKRPSPKTTSKATTSNKRSSSQKMKYVSCEVEKMSKSVHKNEYGGCSSEFTQTQKTGKFVDKKTGRSGYKDVVKYTSSMKCENKFSGCSSEYNTQVTVEKKVVVGPSKGASKSTNRRLKYY